jgi:hypothetical protein
MWHCAGCGGGDDDESGLCLNCADFVDEFVWCKDRDCRASFCEACAFEGGHVEVCFDGDQQGAGCGASYCLQCAEQHMTLYEDEDDDDPEGSFCLCHTCSRAVDPSAEALRVALRAQSSDDDSDEA